ncbi:MAG TPA: YchJ family protein [Dermatophilaceae bacterium]|nr:YchJ family protein [Dermatophilaceae bacterium]
MSAPSVLGRTPSRCPCGSGATYAACCAPLVRAQALAQTAEALMRSRYTAYAVGDVEHLLRTWHPRTRPVALDLDDGPRWTGLVVEHASGGGPGDTEGTVEFRARWSGPGGSGELHEVSRFERRGGRWLYVDGDAG